MQFSPPADRPAQHSDPPPLTPSPLSSSTNFPVQHSDPPQTPSSPPHSCCLPPSPPLLYRLPSTALRSSHWQCCCPASSSTTRCGGKCGDDVTACSPGACPLPLYKDLTHSMSALCMPSQMGGIDESALDRLSLVTEMTKHIRVKAGGGEGTGRGLGKVEEGEGGGGPGLPGNGADQAYPGQGGGRLGRGVTH